MVVECRQAAAKVPRALTCDTAVALREVNTAAADYTSPSSSQVRLNAQLHC